MIGRRWHWSVLDLRRFMGADSDTDHSLEIINISEILAMGKQAAHKFYR